MKSKYTLFSSFFALLLVLVTTGRLFAFNLSAEDSVSALYVREGAKQIRKIIDRREANLAAGIPDDNRYVIDFAEILRANNTSGADYYEDATNLQDVRNAILPNDFQPEKWSESSKKELEQHMQAINSESILQSSGSVIIVALNLYLGTVETDEQIAEYNYQDKVTMLRRERSTEAIYSKHLLLKSILTGLFNVSGKQKFILIAGGYFVQKSSNNKDKIRELWGHEKSATITQDLPYAPIVAALRPIPSSSVKEKVITYTNSIQYFLKGLDQRVINLTTYVNGGQAVTGEELAHYDAFFAKLTGVVSAPSRIKVVYYDSDAQLTALEADPHYKGFVDKKNRLDIKIDASGNIILVTAGFLDPPFMNMGGCFDTKENGVDEKAEKFRETLNTLGVDPIKRRFLYAAYLMYRIVFDTLLCVTDSEHAESTCEGGDGCKFAAGTINGLVEGLDIIGSFEGMVDLTSSLMNWAWDFMKNQITTAYKGMSAPSISAPETTVSAISLGGASIAGNMAHIVSDFSGAKKRSSPGTNRIERIGNMLASAYFKVKEVAGPTLRNTYNYGWVAGSVIGMIIDPPSIEGKLTTLTTKFGISIISDGKKITSGIIKELDKVADVVTVPGKPLQKAVNPDGKIKQLVAAENGIENWLTHSDLLARVKNLPDMPANLRDAFDEDFADPKYYHIVAEFVTGDASINVWQALRRSGSTARFSSASLKKMTRLVANNRFGWDVLKFEKVYTNLLKDVRPGKILKDFDDEGDIIEVIVGKTISEDEFLDIFEELNKRAISKSDGVLQELCCESPWKFVGAEMVLRSVQKGKMWDQIAEFESYFSQINGGRYIDILLKNGKKIEVKSWIRMYKPTFIKQFITKDLVNANSLDGIGWIFDAKYPTNPGLKADILNVLNSSDGRASLKEISASKANQLLKRDDLRDLDKDEIVDAFLEYFTNSSNFDKIFVLQ